MGLMTHGGVRRCYVFGKIPRCPLGLLILVCNIRRMPVVVSLHIPYHAFLKFERITHNRCYPSKNYALDDFPSYSPFHLP